MADKPTNVPIHPKEDPSPRGMSATNAWKPSFDRRQSWSKEDQKHVLQMSAVEGKVQGGAGFTEKGA